MPKLEFARKMIGELSLPQLVNRFELALAGA